MLGLFLQSEMNFTFKRQFLIIFRIFLLVLSVTILTMAFLELTFVPSATLNYYFPALLMRLRRYKNVHQNVLSEPVILLYYIISLLVQWSQVLASVALFFIIGTSTWVSSSHRGWFAYPKLSLLSVALTLSLQVHQQMTGKDVYREVILPDIYYTTSTADGGHYFQCSTYNGKSQCRYSVVFDWHQTAQCCGWNEAQDWLPRHQQHNHSLASRVLPQFCCAPDATTLLINDVLHFKGLSSLAEPCQLNSVNRFLMACADDDFSSFEQYHQLNVFSHSSTSLLYSLLKLATSLLYLLTAKSQLFLFFQCTD